MVNELGTFVWPIDDERMLQTTGFIVLTLGVLTALPTLLYSISQQLAFMTSISFIPGRLPGFLTARIGPMKLTVHEFFLCIAFFTACAAWLAPNAWPERLGNISAAAFVLVVFPACRATLLSFTTHLSMERLLKSHELIGKGTVLLVFCHGMAYYVQWIADGTFFEKVVRMKYLSGTVGFFAFGFLFLTSLMKVRRQHFEIFYYSHIIGWIVALVCACLHAHTTIPFMAVPLLWWLADRGVRAYRSSRPVQVVSATSMGPDMVKLVLRTPMSFEAGAYVFLNVPALKTLQWHPFTISSAHQHGDASSPAGLATSSTAISALWSGDEATAMAKHLEKAQTTVTAGATISLHIKTLGKWTTNLKSLVDTGAEFQVKLDGPYGALSVPVDQYKTIVLISGGVGVTPMVSVLLETWRKLSAKTPGTKLTRLHFIWVARDHATVSWFVDTLRAISTSSMSTSFLFTIYLTREAPEAPVFNSAAGVFVHGRPGKWSTVLASVADTLDKDETRVGVLTCGPDSMITEVLDVCTAFSMDKFSGCIWDCHKETFDF